MTHPSFPTGTSTRANVLMEAYRDHVSNFAIMAALRQLPPDPSKYFYNVAPTLNFFEASLIIE